jgi:hypothetical protein
MPVFANTTSSLPVFSLIGKDLVQVVQLARIRLRLGCFLAQSLNSGSRERFSESRTD